MSTWLQTETRSWLEQVPPDKFAPADSAAFTLVLLASQARDRARLLRAIRRGCLVSDERAQQLLAQPLPIVLKRELSYADAAIGQYELIAADAVSVIVADGVVRYPPPAYLQELYAALLKSTEFELVTVTIELPPSPQTGELLEHFLGSRNADLWSPLSMMRKKSRILAHLAAKIGGRVMIQSGPV